MSPDASEKEANPEMPITDDQLSVTSQQDGTTTTVAITGWVTTVSASQVEDILSRIPDTTTTLVFDLTDTRYISSYGIRLLIMSYKRLAKRGGTVVIRHPNEFVLDTLTMAGVINAFEIEL